MAVKRALNSKEDYNLDQEVSHVYNILVFMTKPLIVSHVTILENSIHINRVAYKIPANRMLVYKY